MFTYKTDDVKQLDISQLLHRSQKVLSRLMTSRHEIDIPGSSENFHEQLILIEDIILEFAHRYQKLLNERKDEQ